MYLIDVFTLLDEILDDHSKEELKHSKDVTSHHMGFGMWIRNNCNLWSNPFINLTLVEEVKKKDPDLFDYYVTEHFKDLNVEGDYKLNTIFDPSYESKECVSSVYFPDQVSGLLMLAYQKHLLKKEGTAKFPQEGITLI